MTTVYADRERVLVAAFVTLADTLVSGYDVVGLLYDLLETCTGLVAADAAAILLADAGGRPQVMAYTSEKVHTLTLDELDSGHGPGLDCYRSGRPLSVADLTADGPAARWARFTDHAAQSGFRAAHAVPLRLRGQIVGAMTVFGAEPGALPAPDLMLCQALADVATIGILQERAIAAAVDLSAQLQTALTSRILIEQAKGMLIERSGLGPDEAFAQLRRYARDHNLKLTAAARDILANKIIIDPAARHPKRPD